MCVFVCACMCVLCVHTYELVCVYGMRWGWGGVGGWGVCSCMYMKSENRLWELVLSSLHHLAPEDGPQKQVHFPTEQAHQPLLCFSDQWDNSAGDTDMD